MDGDVLHCKRCGGTTEERLTEGRARPVCRECGFVTYLDPKLAVAVVLERDGLVLLGKRGPGARAAGKWSFPAGFVERGEVVEEAAIREVREETGYSIAIGSLIALLSSSGETVVLAVYTGTILSGDSTPDDDLTELGWFSPGSLPELAFPHDMDILERIARGVGACAP